jgi:signal peptidase I
MKFFSKEILKIFLLALLIVLPIRLFLFQPFFVDGNSMLPNFHHGNYLIINQIGYKTTQVGIGGATLFTVRPWKELERGDIIVFRAPGEKRQFFIKRIVGLPGETVAVRGGKVVIASGDDEFTLDESYLPSERRTLCNGVPQCDAVTLSDEEYYVLGDNRGASSDSRVWGPLPRSEVIGMVLLRAWPLTDFAFYRHGAT